MSKNSNINIADLRGLTRLLTDASLNVTELVEDVHHRIVNPPIFPTTPIQSFISGVSGLAYGSVRLSTKLIGGGFDKTLAFINPERSIGLSLEKKETLLAVLNGVIGDHLVESKNPLATKMEIRVNGAAVSCNAQSIRNALPEVNGKILLMVHGLCNSDAIWNGEEHNHGTLLADEMGFTSLFLKYNSGLHISSNGKKLSRLLEELTSNWPVPVEELHIIGFSMGGLVSRSAVHYAEEHKNKWRGLLKNMIFLGTPHHGAPLERLGHFVNQMFSLVHYTKPFTRLGNIRSVGITDLRYGNLIREDWEGKDRFEASRDQRENIPLPKKVNCFAVAAVLEKANKGVKARFVGDGLVQVDSAHGLHKDKLKQLKFKKKNTHIVFQTNHDGLLSDSEVYDKMKSWLA